MLEVEDKKKQIEEEIREASIRDYLFKLKVQERLESDALELAEERGYKRGIEEVRKYRREKACIIMAEKMYELGVSKEIICEVTGLTEEKLNRIILK